MCLYIKSPTKLLSKKYIICYKIGTCYDGVMRPFYQSGFKYFKGKVTEKVPLKIINEEIHEGYHSYISSRHSTNQICLIPPNTEYYEGIGGEYASSQLIWMGPDTGLTWIKTYWKIFLYLLTLKS